MILLYLFIAFIIFFFTYKRKIEDFENEDIGRYSTTLWIERKSFWIIFLVPTFWIVSIPIVIMWVILEKIYNKLCT